MEMLDFIFDNISVILLVVSECIYVILYPSINKDFELKRVFDFRRTRNIKINAAKNLCVIGVAWIAYMIICDLCYKNTYDIHEIFGDELPSVFNVIGKIGLLAYPIILITLYMLNSGMAEKLFYKVMLILVFASVPVIMIIGIIRESVLNRYMFWMAIGYAIVLIIVLKMFIHFWKKEDVR